MVFYSRCHSLYSHNSYYSHYGKLKGAQSVKRRTPIKGRLPDLIRAFILLPSWLHRGELDQLDISQAIPNPLDNQRDDFGFGNNIPQDINCLKENCPPKTTGTSSVVTSGVNTLEKSIFPEELADYMPLGPKRTENYGLLPAGV